MPKSKFDKDKAYLSIIGAVASQEQPSVDSPIVPEMVAPVPPPAEEKKKQKGFYLPERYYKALRLRMYLSDSPRDKNQSSILQAALDIYLAEELKQVK